MASDQGPICVTCERSWPEKKRGRGYFGHFTPEELPAADDLLQFGQELTILIGYSKALYHAIWCTWQYEENAYGGLRHESIEPLTCMGQSLSEEIERRVGNLSQAGRIWKARAEATTTATQQETAEPEGGDE